MANSTIKFPQEMPPAATINGSDKIMIADAATNEAKSATWEAAKQYLNITGIELKPVPAGALPAGPADQERKMQITDAGTWTFGGSSFVNPDGSVMILWWSGSTWSIADQYALPTAQGTNVVIEGGTEVVNQDGVFKAVKPLKDITNETRQIFDKENDNIELGGMYASNGALFSGNNNLRVKFGVDKLEVGITYTLSRTTELTTAQGNISFFNSSGVVISHIPVTDLTKKTFTFTVPVGTSYSYICIGFLTGVNNLPLRDNLLVNTTMLNSGSSSLPYEPFQITIKTEAINRYNEVEDLLDSGLIENENELIFLAESDIIVFKAKKNILNPDNVDFLKRYSPGSSSIVAAGATQYTGSGMIRVSEGEWYAGNFEAIDGGGYFINESDTVAYQSITFVRPVDNIGWAFQVPIGFGIKYVFINLRRIGTSGTVLSKDYQIEKGEQTTSYEPYTEVKQINESLLPTSSAPPVQNSDLLDDLIDVNVITKLNHDKLPLFFKNSRLKEKNVMVVMNGTSLTARTTEHCSAHPRANERPPLFDSNNMASHIWDSLRWDSQFYRRYDFQGFFLESGTWITASNTSQWDDGDYRNGLTRYSDDIDSSFSLVVPVNAWQFNLIMRTDQLGTENAKITIAEGNGKIEVFNGSDWVEANNFVFSQKQDEIILPTVTVPNPVTETQQVIPNYKIGGNTTYQKRLKMRCKSSFIDSLNTTKNILITRDTGRLMYWGVEWSVREFMITLVNAARGSHNITLNSPMCLTHYQENEVWSFEPDLILTENPIHNSGGGSAPIVTFPTTYWAETTQNFFFNESNPVSLKTRSAIKGLNPEYLIYTSSISWNFGGINEDGTLKLGTDKNGKSYTALESQSMAHQSVLDNQPNVLAINSVNFWVKTGFDVYANLRLATTGSGKSGKTFTNEGSHWNDTGSKVIAKSILPYLNFDM